jgi:diguanylate cyclase (GGDEF)-like protein
VQAKVLKDLLQDRGYAVRAASDGREALDMVREKRPTLIISDVVMPVMNGYDLCFALKQDEMLRDVPVILLTSLADTSDIVLGLMARADYYLTKPYSSEYLLSTITELLKQPPSPPDEENLRPLEVQIGSERHEIKASRQQMLSLLLSTYGNSVEQNRVLIQVQRELRALNDQLREQSQQIIDQQRKLEDANMQLHSLATIDGLTQLKNHRAFKEKLDEELDRAARYDQPLSLLLLDADAFKAFNDEFGHPSGDEVLVTLGRLLNQNTRGADLAARYGGEEFAVLLPNTDKEWAIFMAERLRSAIENTPWPQRAITASFGVATFHESNYHGDAGAALIKAADKALYNSKNAGRNRVSHSDDILKNS